MFLLQYSLNTKIEERRRLEKIMKVAFISKTSLHLPQTIEGGGGKGGEGGGRTENGRRGLRHISTREGQTVDEGPREVNRNDLLIGITVHTEPSLKLKLPDRRRKK